VIRLLTIDDAEELGALYAANRDFLAPFDPVRPDDFFTAAGQRERVLAHDLLYGILDGRAIAGVLAINNVALGAFRSASFGYFVDAARNGRGLASAAVADAVEVCFGELGLHRVEAGTLVDNTASQRVLERNRFTRIGLAPHYLHIAGEWRDHYLFQRTVED
jgi:[ribosomal protein S5]-alanine N-acetyltransferase